LFLLSRKNFIVFYEHPSEKIRLMKKTGENIQPEQNNEMKKGG